MKRLEVKERARLRREKMWSLDGVRRWRRDVEKCVCEMQLQEGVP